MKQAIRNATFGIVGLSALVVGVMSVTTEVAAKDYRFKMWIAPLECTRNEVSDGITTTTILTPKQCDDLMHPPSKPQPGKPSRPTPDAPDTGKFSDTWTTVGMTGILSILVGGIAILVTHDRKLHMRGSLQNKRR